MLRCRYFNSDLSVVIPWQINRLVRVHWQTNCQGTAKGRNVL